MGDTTENSAAQPKPELTKQKEANLTVDTSNGNPIPSSPGNSPNTIRRVTVVVDRPVYTQSEFDEGHEAQARKNTPIRESIKYKLSKCTCSSQCFKAFLYKLFPFVNILRKYDVKSDLPNDIISGLTVGIMHIPQGMAYALLAEVAPIYGLYVSLFPVLLYFFLGTSRHISLGTFAVTCLMIGSTVTKNYPSFCAQYINQAPATTAAPLDQSTVAAQDHSTATGFSFQPVNGSTALPIASAGGISDLDKCKAQIATSVSLMAAVIQLGMGIFHLGFMTIYLSDPLTRGFTTGAACHVFTSQIKYVFGIEVQRFSGAFKLIYSYIDMFSKIAQTQLAAVLIAVICIVILYVTKEYINPKVKAKIKMPVPIELIVVILGTLISHFAKFNERFNVKVVGFIPRGIPPPSVPPPSLYGLVIGDAVALAIVSFAISVSMAKLFAAKHNYDVDSNTELVAYGITNSVTSFLNCFMASVSLSRSLVQEGTGGRTQVAGLVSCCLLLVVILALGPLFEQLPNAVLAGIILVALKGMFLQLKDLKKLWFINKYDFAIWLVVFLSTVILDVDLGLLIGVAFSLLTVVFRTQRPYSATLGRVPHTDIYKDVNVYNAAQEVPGIKIFRFEAALYYANKDHFVYKLAKKAGVNARKLKIRQTKVEVKIKKEKAKQEKLRKRHQNDKESRVAGNSIAEEDFAARFVIPKSDVHHIIIDCATMGFIDSVGVTTLGQIIREYDDVGIRIVLASCKVNVREMLEVAGFFENIDKDRLYLSIHDAVLSSLEKNPDILEKMNEPAHAEILSTYM